MHLAQCVCPLFQPKMLVKIDNSCKYIDCLWTLPKLDISQTITVKSNWTANNLSEALYFIKTKANRTIRHSKLMNESQERLDVSEEEKKMVDFVLHYRRHAMGECMDSCNYSFFEVSISSQSTLSENSQGNGAVSEEDETSSKSVSFWKIAFFVLLVLVVAGLFKKRELQNCYRSYAPVSFFGNRNVDDQSVSFDLE
ncbi:hypothetical protein PMAYCL1PPCAC_21106 [Pristionchus mayeri]|uniref:Uncharacterized protein n=1 Tax=Pristionchus mayeri TaxID=1317129 RepID=A0AAN5I4Z3_9BILA|nr:hypothetical protein PMAYCL1PPCAC_21106 [Pristionchus mayeri]